MEPASVALKPETHAEAVRRWLAIDGVGIEIGAFKNPLPGIRPFYVDRNAEYGLQDTHADFIAPADRLPFRSHSLDYVASSHVFEHLPNPVAALAEWHRVLRPGGIIYLVVPDRRFTFDHPRRITDPEHMWDDYRQHTGSSDATHIHEFVDGVDWSRFQSQIPPDDVPREREILREKYRIASHGGEIDIHFHVFEPENLQALVEIVAARLQFDWTILTLQSPFPVDCPNGILLVVRVEKPFPTRLHARWHQWRAKHDRNHVVMRAARRGGTIAPGRNRG